MISSTIMDNESAMMAMSRPQVGIDRLQARKPVMEQKEAMNCKSCRKRKVWLFDDCTNADD